MAWIFGIGFVGLWLVGCAVSGMASTRIDASLPGERDIPFIAAAIPIYVSMDLAMVLLPLAFRSGRDLLPLALTMLAQAIVAAICFVLFPLQAGFAQRPDGIWGEVFGEVGLPNLAQFGYAPSLHVTFAIIMAACVSQRWRGHWPLVLWTWAAGVSISTVLVHEHLIVDVISGVILGAAGIPLLRRLERWSAQGSVRSHTAKYFASG
ncbi:MAG: phosphatase PAP2 family protein [Phycisphaerales bacterium]|nr:phosphatase PAP2 family protein [Phycisphaerales bacterium]